MGVLKEIKVELKTKESKSCSCRSQPTDKYSVNSTGLQAFPPKEHLQATDVFQATNTLLVYAPTLENGCGFGRFAATQNIAHILRHLQ